VEGGILFRDDIILNWKEHEILVLSAAAAAGKIQRIGICSAESRLLIVYIVAMMHCALLTLSSLTNFFFSSKILLGCPVSGVKNLAYIFTRGDHCLMCI